MNKPAIGLLDCNNFFVSCERLFRPDLVGKPVLVLSSNDGCVVARSQEVKDIGVPMGVPYFQVKDIIKKERITTFSSHFALYRDISRRVMRVLQEEFAQLEQYSIDEAFFALPTVSQVRLTAVKERVEREVGIPVSIGVGATKTQAKAANGMAKKGLGICVLTPQDWEKLTKTLPLAAIWGVGGKSELAYKKHGLVLVDDLIKADPARVQRLFGVAGARLQRELSGVPVHRVEQRIEPQHSVMSSRSFRDATTTKQVVADAVAYHVRHVAAELRQMQLETSTIRVFIRPARHGDYALRGGGKEAVLVAPTNDSFALLHEASRLLDELFESGVPYKKVGVVCSDLVGVGGGQQQLFGGDSIPAKSQAVLAVVDALNARSGREVVLLGSHLHTSQWQARSEQQSPSYTTKWSDIAAVSAQ